MEILHRGFDKLEVAFNGALPAKLRGVLEAAKRRAVSNVEPECVDFRGFDIWVKETGAKGGYAFVFSTAEEREMWAIKDNDNPENWNLRCVVSSASLAVEGWHAVKDRLLLQLKTWGVRCTEISVSRVDFAVDFVAPEFALHPDRLICHSHATVGGYPDKDGDPDQMAVYWKNRRVTSLTIGKMPGRQIICYDKSREVRASGKRQWFDIWGKDPDDREQVWRIEVRAGKDHLSRAGIKSFEDVEAKIGTLFRVAMDKVRLAAVSGFENATRVPVDPVWSEVQGIVTDALEDATGAVTFERIIEGRREEIASIYRKQILGCALGYAVTMGKTLKGTPEQVVDTVRSIAGDITDDIEVFFDGDRNRFHQKFERARARLKFLEPAADHEGMPNGKLRNGAVFQV